MEMTLECQEILTMMTIVVCSEKNRCLLKCQPNDWCATESEDSTAVLLCLKSNNYEKKWPHIAVEWWQVDPYKNGQFCSNLDSGDIAGDSYLF